MNLYTLSLHNYWNASSNRIRVRRWWEENAGLGVACFLLFCSLMSRCIEEHYPRSRGLAACLLPLSAFFSVRTLFRLLDRYLPTISWWARGLVRWLSWWMLHTVLMILPAIMGFLVFAMLSPMLSEIFALIALLVIPMLLLVRQVVQDYTNARQIFGSLAEAVRVTRGVEPTFARRGYSL